jgi:hypothetical protein
MAERRTGYYEGMMTESALKKAIKEAVVAVMREERQFFTEVVLEAMEEASLHSAIRAGSKSKTVSREQVFRALRGRRR